MRADPAPAEAHAERVDLPHLVVGTASRTIPFAHKPVDGYRCLVWCETGFHATAEAAYAEAEAIRAGYAAALARAPAAAAGPCELYGGSGQLPPLNMGARTPAYRPCPRCASIAAPAAAQAGPGAIVEAARWVSEAFDAAPPEAGTISPRARSSLAVLRERIAAAPAVGADHVLVPREPTPEILEPFARLLCEAKGIDPDDPAPPHGDVPTWFYQCGALAEAWETAIAAAPGPDRGEAELRAQVERLEHDLMVMTARHAGVGDAADMFFDQFTDQFRKRCAVEARERDALAMILFVGLCGGERVARFHSTMVRACVQREEANAYGDEEAAKAEAAEQRAATAEARAERAIAALRRCEWVGRALGPKFCPLCGARRGCPGQPDEGHAPGCALAAQLGGPARAGESGPALSQPTDCRAASNSADPAAAGRAAVRRAVQPTDDELAEELKHLQARWDDLFGDPDFEGHGGSPGESLYERMQEIETEQERRRALNHKEQPK